MNYRKTNYQKGFTIVELLIVIVVIGILAAITIVAFNGVQNRGKTASAQSTAQGAIKKAEAHNAQLGYYPTTAGVMTGAANTETYALPGVSLQTSLSNTSANNAIIISICGTGSPANLAAITTSNVSGITVQYRDYSASSNTTVRAGTTTGTGVACHTSSS